MIVSAQLCSSKGKAVCGSKIRYQSVPPHHRLYQRALALSTCTQAQVSSSRYTTSPLAPKLTVHGALRDSIFSSEWICCRVRYGYRCGNRYVSGILHVREEHTQGRARDQGSTASDNICVSPELCLIITPPNKKEGYG